MTHNELKEMARSWRLRYEIYRFLGHLEKLGKQGDK